MTAATASGAACSAAWRHARQAVAPCVGLCAAKCVALGVGHVQRNAVLAVGTALSRVGGVPGGATGAWSCLLRSARSSTAVHERKKRKGQTTPFFVSLMRSPNVVRA